MKFINKIYTNKMTEYKCVICYDKKCCITTTCGHQFCDECIGKWTEKNPSCPYCRHVFDQQEQLNIIFYKKPATRSNTFYYRQCNANNTIHKMLQHFLTIEGRDKQIIEAAKICKYMYNSISCYKDNEILLTTFLDRINYFVKEGVKECGIIRFKLRERNII